VTYDLVLDALQILEVEGVVACRCVFGILPEVERTLKVAAKVAKKYRNALRELAK